MKLGFSEYQEATNETAVYPGKGKILPGRRPGDDVLMGLLYLICGKIGELGEVAEKIKKVIRDKDAVFSVDDIVAIGKEMGDEGWYQAQLAETFNLDLGLIAGGNIEKLRSRKERGVLGGSGDDR